MPTLHTLLMVYEVL